MYISFFPTGILYNIVRGICKKSWNKQIHLKYYRKFRIFREMWQEFLPGTWLNVLRSVHCLLPVCFDLVSLYLRSCLFVLCPTLFSIITDLPLAVTERLPSFYLFWPCSVLMGKGYSGYKKLYDVACDHAS